jgi:hypothetical protein
MRSSNGRPLRRLAFLVPMSYAVPFDKLHDKLMEVDGRNPGPDGRWTLYPMRRSLTLTSAKHHIGNEYVVVSVDNWDDIEMSWESADVFRLRVDTATFAFQRDQVGEILDVNLPEQPFYRSVSIELVTELTIDFTVEYEHRESGADG